MNIIEEKQHQCKIRNNIFSLAKQYMDIHNSNIIHKHILLQQYNYYISHMIDIDNQSLDLLLILMMKKYTILYQNEFVDKIETTDLIQETTNNILLMANIY